MKKWLVLIWLSISLNAFAQQTQKIHRTKSPKSGHQTRPLDLKTSKKYGLEVISLRKKDLERLPDSLSKHSELRKLDLSKNKLKVVPEQIRSLQKLEEIDLSKNEIERLPLWLGELPHLKVLKLSHNKVDSLIIPPNSFPSLEYLDFWESDLMFLDPEICRLPNIKAIDLRHTYLGTRDLEWLYQCLGEEKVESTWGCDCN